MCLYVVHAKRFIMKCFFFPVPVLFLVPGGISCGFVYYIILACTLYLYSMLMRCTCAY